jgi:hypothetical protein
MDVEFTISLVEFKRFCEMRLTALASQKGDFVGDGNVFHDRSSAADCE